MKSFVGFAGFGGVDLALREAGFEVIGVEIDDEIAEVNRLNGGNVITADILDMDPRKYVGYELMHFSPPCPGFSIANQKRGETVQDIELGRKTARFIIDGQPEFFTLENVWAYRNSESWSIILKALHEMGYGVDFWLLNSANFGVPQTRKRMIAVARWDGQQPARPVATHQDYRGMQLALFEMLPKWRGWYEAISDLIPALPDSEFADWQNESMPPLYRTMLVGQQLPNGREGEVQTRLTEIPAMTVTAFIVDCQYNSGADENGKRGLTIREDDRPVFTVTATQAKRQVRAYVEGRVVSMTLRCLARFQGFPYWFVLPEARGLACRGVGNAVPPGLYVAVLGSRGFGEKETYTGDKI